MSETDALAHILGQIRAAKAELDQYDPVDLDWYDRSNSTANTLVPWLVQEARKLRLHVEQVLNSPSLLRETWSKLRVRIDAPTEVIRMDELLDYEAALLKFIAGDTVSSVVTDYLLSACPDGALAGNSKSDYPDIFLNTIDYSMLPVRNRTGNKFGAAVRGKKRKPVRVPDGLEIKTSRNNASIDCHYPHIGLHLMLSFSTTGGSVIVDDVLLAYLATADYRITVPKTKATTLKASFSRASFMSLLSDP
jgi:hypothetical protein